MLCFIVSIQVPTVPPRRGGLHREASATLALLDIPWLVPAGWGTALLRVGHPPVDDAKGGIFKCLSRKCDATRLRPCCGRICSCWGRLDHCLGRHSAICTLVAIQALGSTRVMQVHAIQAGRLQVPPNRTQSRVMSTSAEVGSITEQHLR